MEAQAIMQPTADTPERRAFYAKIDKQNLTPLWLSLAELVTPEPRSACRPASYAGTSQRLPSGVLAL